MKSERSGIVAAILAAAFLAGCGTSPAPRYHALGLASDVQGSGSAARLVEVLPVGVPERLNRDEMVLTTTAGQLDVRDGDHWAAPLPDEIRHILDDALWRYLRAADVYQAPVAPGADGVPHYRLALQIERFAATPGRSAIVEGSWTVRVLPQGKSVTCRAGISVPLSGLTADAAVAALSEGMGRLARLVSDSIEGFDRGGGACPSA